MADISKVTLPSGTTYNLKDQQARNDIATLKETAIGAMHYLGVTSTSINDGSSTNPITIGGADVTAKNGDVVIFGKLELVFSDSDAKWHEYGSTGSLKSLAFADSATGTYTPSGNVSQPVFTGKEQTIKVNTTPTGTVSAPTITTSLNTATVNSITDVGSLPSCTLPKMTASVENETLSLGWTDGAWNAGKLPTKGNNVVVATGIKSIVASEPTFTGTESEGSATFTPSGTVSKPSFTGSSASVTVTAKE